MKRATILFFLVSTIAVLLVYNNSQSLSNIPKDLERKWAIIEYVGPSGDSITEYDFSMSKVRFVDSSSYGTQEFNMVCGFGLVAPDTIGTYYLINYYIADYDFMGKSTSEPIIHVEEITVLS